jgi:hypothetical protein
MAHTVPRRYLRNDKMNPKIAHRLILAALCALAVCVAAAVILPIAAHAQAPATAVALSEPQAAEIAVPT